MESLLAQVEAWLITLIDKQVEPLIEKRISASFEDETSYITRYINALIDTKIDNNSKQLDGYMGTHEFETDVEEIIDNCIADKIRNNFDISDFDSEIEDIAEGVARNAISDLDISEYHEEIESLVDDRIFSTSFTISVST